MTICIGRVLGGFHNMVDQRLIGRQHWIGRDGTWIYPPLEDAMAEAGLQEVETYAYFLHYTFVQFIDTRTIMDLYLAADWRPGPRISNRWR